MPWTQQQRPQAAGVSETHLLSQLIAPPPPRETFKLALFHDDDVQPSGGASSGGSGGPSDVIVFSSTKDDMNRANAALYDVANSLSSLSVAGGGAGRGSNMAAGDDLLDLMDQA